MNRYHSYINTSIRIIESYTGEVPLAVFIKQFFSAEKKYGSKDRKEIAALCYHYFRIGFAAEQLSKEDKFILATFLCTEGPSALLEKLKPDWAENQQLSLQEKLRVVRSIFSVKNIFPYQDLLSDGIDVEQFCISFLVQPALFLRIRPQSSVSTFRKLKKLTTPYVLISDGCVQMPSASKIDELFLIDKEVVVQDFNSQQVFNYLKENHQRTVKKDENKAGFSVWDCCAASGGKSILLYDIVKGKFELTVSDIRASIILNLHQRFKKAGIKEYKYFVADISNTDTNPPASDYDCIICDVPCTGSGTWSRTPEQLRFFHPSAVDEFSDRQKKIITNVLPHLQNEGMFVYITCSVFKKENEDMVSFIRQQFNCILLHQALLEGYEKKADSMFVAVFKRSSVL